VRGSAQHDGDDVKKEGHVKGSAPLCRHVDGASGLPSALFAWASPSGPSLRSFDILSSALAHPAFLSLQTENAALPHHHHHHQHLGVEILFLLVAEDLSAGQLDPPTFPLPEHPTGHGHPSRLCCSPHPTLGSTRSCQTSHRYSCSSASGHPMSARRQSQTCPAQATRQESEWGGVGVG
jgi:hypothetical protein